MPKTMLEEELPGVYVHSIMIGDNVIVDTESGFFRDTNRQIAEVRQNTRNWVISFLNCR
jgi:palmitoyl-protein thioesterase